VTQLIIIPGIIDPHGSLNQKRARETAWRCSLGKPRVLSRGDTALAFVLFAFIERVTAIRSEYEQH
jgi:hypothetical protein